VSMRFLISFSLMTLLACCAGIQSSFVASTNPPAVKAASEPVIYYAEWVGKTLQVEGDRFADGATVLIDGQSFNSYNDETYPRFNLYARKALKRLTPDSAIHLQVQNPDGGISNEFMFYTGFVVTLGFQGSWIKLHVGDRFLLFLPPKGDPPTIGWFISMTGDAQGVLNRTTDDLPIPHTQGLFAAVGPGQVIIDAQGSPLCPPLPPEYCGPLGFFMGFDVGIKVK
jgi:hypothetical protein